MQKYDSVTAISTVVKLPHKCEIKWKPIQTILYYLWSNTSWVLYTDRILVSDPKPTPAQIAHMGILGAILWHDR